MTVSKYLKVRNQTSPYLRKFQREKHDIIGLLEDIQEQQDFQQQGQGLVSFLTKKVRNPIRQLVNKTGIIKNVSPLFPGELHAPFHNWAGPGTNIDERLKRGTPYSVPTTQTDAAAKVHDIDYKEIKDAYKAGDINKDQARQATRIADQKMLRSLDQIRDKSVLEKTSQYITKQIMQGKNELEDIQAISPTKFSLGEGVGNARMRSSSEHSPIRDLRMEAVKYDKKKKNKKQKGEGAFLTGLIASLVPIAIEQISKAIKK